MGRPKTIPREDVLPLLKQGMGDVEVATYFTEKGKRVSKQGIRLIRLEFEKTGELERRERRRGRRPRVRDDGHKTELEQVIDLSIKAFEALKKLPLIEAELVKTRHCLKNALEMLETERKEGERYKDQERRFKLAVTQGDAKPPLNTSGKPPVSKMESNLTYHIDCATQNSVVPTNITEDILKQPILSNIIMEFLERCELDEERTFFNDKNCVLWQRR